ncbi:MAG: hypothetical protein HN708_10475 [Candidatus Marinimicrobia bacterium]|nr:hypothetical protein [Candidatus Neomarinimicrobiota bacterium]
MDTTLHPVLACGEGAASDITVFLSREGTTYEVYLGVALLERVGADPESVSRKMLVGRLCNAGVSLRELGETFGHDPRTIRRWATALLTSDIDEIARVFAGRARKRKVSPELIRYARQLYRERHLLDRNYRDVIISRIAEVFGVRVSTTTASAIFASDPEGRFDAESAPERAIGLQNDRIPSTESDGSVKQSPTPIPAQTAPAGGGTKMIHHAGQALFVEGMKGVSDPLQRQFITQILQGAVNVEQSKTLCGRSLAHFTGPIVTELKEQRDGLDEQADAEEVLRAYSRNGALLSDGPNRGDLFYFDPHTKEYTGQLKVLKGWCGRQHSIVKTINLDSFHTRSGRPCFIQHYSPYYDMRERFFMSLAQFNRLFVPEKRQGRTFVIDRGIYALATLQAFPPDRVITWEKGYDGGGWDENGTTITFCRSLPKNSGKDLRTSTFHCQQSPWRRDPSFRRIIVRAARAGRECIEVSIITSHPDMDIQDVVWAILRRWLQENDFKYLDTHFGINQLTSRDSNCFRDKAGQFEDRPIDSPEYRELRSSSQALEAALGKKLVQLRKQEKQNRELEMQMTNLEARRARLQSRLEKTVERLRNDLPPPRGCRNIERESAEFRRTRDQIKRKLQSNVGRREKLHGQIASVEKDIEPLQAQLCNAVRKQSRLQLLLDGNYQLIDTRKKAMMDALRVTASNIFRNVQEQFRAIYDNYRDDHVLVRMLSRCSGTMTNTAQSTTFRLWLSGTLQPHRVRAIESLLRQVQQRTNAEITSVRPIRLELLSGPLDV